MDQPKARDRKKTAEEIGWKVLRWAVFGVIVGAWPFLYNLWTISDRFHSHWWYFKLWPHGELALLAVAVSADGLNECFFGRYSKRLLGVGGIRFLVVVGSFLVLGCATFVFAGAQVLPEHCSDDLLKDYARASEATFVASLVVTFVSKLLPEE
jgi:hypothetical protein